MPVNVSVKILAKVTAGFAKEVDDVNQYPAEIYNPTEGATKSLFNLKVPRIIINKPKVAIDSDRKILMPDLLFCESWNTPKSNIRFANITPINPPISWAGIKLHSSNNEISFLRNMTKLTHGLKWAPDILINVQISAVSPAPVAIVFARRMIDVSLDKLLAIIPDPTTTITKKLVPISSERNLELIKLI